MALKLAFAASVSVGLGLTVAFVRNWRARAPPVPPPTEQQQDDLALSRMDGEGGPAHHEEPIKAPLPSAAISLRTLKTLSNAQLRVWLDVSPR
jgi:hypothetical protein